MTNSINPTVTNEKVISQPANLSQSKLQGEAKNAASTEKVPDETHSAPKAL